MDPREFLKGLDYGRLVDLGYEGTDTMFPLAILQESIGADLGVNTVDEVLVGLQLIHDEMLARGLKPEARNLWDRLNESIEGGYFGGKTYEEVTGQHGTDDIL